jgi:Tfp pilus assembly protein PilF
MHRPAGPHHEGPAPVAPERSVSTPWVRRLAVAIRYRSVDEIKETLQNARARKRGCSLLIGAGCSVKAGIPAAGGFVDIIKDRYRLAYQRAAEKTYPKCMAELLLSERRDLIGSYVDAARLNWAHLCIALLIQEGYVDRVLTTNFDLLVVRACAMLGVFPAIYDFASSQLLKTADIPGQAVFYLHGQRTGFVLMNTVEDMDKHAKLLGPVFEDAGSGRVWIVVGYSGENDPVFDHLARVPRFDNGLFWVGYGDREPAGHVREQLLLPDKDAFYTKGFDADSFFVSLTRALGVFPPDLVARPFTYLNRALTTITPFHDPGQTAEDDVMRDPRRWIEQAIAQFEQPAWDMIRRVRAPAATDLQRPTLLTVAAQYLLMAGRYDEVVGYRDEWAASRSAELGHVLSIAYVLRGNQFLDRAKATAGPEADALFGAARGEYEAALQVKPDRHEALHNWGNALLDQAKRTTGPEAEQLFAEAEQKYRAALALDGTLFTVLICWGNLLLDRGKALTDDAPAAERFFDGAERKYAAALAIQPGAFEAVSNWGNLLLDRGKTRSGAAAEHLFVAAEEKYRAALAIEPEMPDVLCQWGNALLDRAKLRGPGAEAEADRLFAAAQEKYAEALRIKSDMHQALENWGNALLDLAKTRAGGEAERLFRQAEAKYRAALDVNPGSASVLGNWANLLADWERLATAPPQASAVAEARQRYEAARAARPGAAPDRSPMTTQGD